MTFRLRVLFFLAFSLVITRPWRKEGRNCRYEFTGTKHSAGMRVAHLYFDAIFIEGLARSGPTLLGRTLQKSERMSLNQELGLAASLSCLLRLQTFSIPAPTLTHFVWHWHWHTKPRLDFFASVSSDSAVTQQLARFYSTKTSSWAPNPHVSSKEQHG